MAEDQVWVHTHLQTSCPVVYLHGFAGTPADWESVVAASHLPGTGLCLPGHSPQYPVPTDFSSATDQLLARWPTQPATIVGYSLGGRLGLAIAATAPERVRQLILVAAHTGLCSTEDQQERIQLDNERAHALRTKPQQFFSEWDKLPLFQGPPTPHLQPWLARRAQLDPDALSRVMEVLSLGRMPSYRKVLGDQAIPCTLIAGALDKRFITHYRSLLRMHPKLRLEVIENAAHRVMIDNPQGLGNLLRSIATKST